MSRRKNDEWYTPQVILDAARRALGGEVDLDPASCDEANRIVRARHYYRLPDYDGLVLTWEAERLWLNPPYSDPKPFVGRLLEGWRTGNVGAACIILTSTAALGTRYGYDLQQSADLMCSPGRVWFVAPNGTPGRQPRDASVIFAGGPRLDVDRAEQALRLLGPVWRKP